MTSRRLSPLLLPLLPALLGALLLGACGGDEADADGMGGEGAAANGSGGNGTGGAGTGGAGTGGAGTGGAGTGGSGTGGGTAAVQPPGTDNYNCDAAAGTIPTLAFEDVVTGLSQANFVTHAPNETTRLFVVEKGGLLKLVKDLDGTPVTTTFLNISTKLVEEADDERGFLGMAFHPDYAANGLFYVHYSAAPGTADADEGDTIIEEYKVSADADVADAASGRRVIRVDQPSNTEPGPAPGSNGRNHNGGTITFGPDGFLYISLGDGGGYNDTYQNAQDVTTLLGATLRINPLESGEDAYTSPTDNLKSVMASAAPEIWNYGLRNPYRMNFDGCTGDLYIGDVGQGAWEEVNVEPPGQGRRNYGWPVMEGLECLGGGNGCTMTGMTPPLHVFENSGGSSVVGGSVYRGSEIPALRGKYFFADITGKMWFAEYNGTTLSAPVDVTSQLNPGLVVSIQNGGDGELYVTDFGTLKKIVAQ